MRLGQIEIENFRNLEKVSLSFDPGTCAIIGKNAQGKPVYKSITDTDKNRLRQTAADYKIKHGTSGAKFGNQTLGDAMENYISVKKPVLSPSTKGYTAAQKVFKTEFGAFCEKTLQYR